jgi:1-deoxy-D-xylulose-5-phosphate reductoisomerase
VESASNAGQRRNVILLGSTGSIGTQAADIIGRNPDRFRLTGIAAGGGHPELLARQAIDLGAEVVAVANAAAVPDVRSALAVAGSADGARR